MINQISPDKILVLFDGTCLLCSRTVRMILKHDKRNVFVFAPLQTFRVFDISDHIDSVVVCQNGILYYKSDGILIIAKELGGIFSVLFLGKMLPRKWRDCVYDWIARNRKRWFGVSRTCFVPPPEYQDRFL